MKFIEWTSDLDTGFHDIDKQHQELVFHINKFYQANEAGDKERMSIVLFDLIASAHSHFEYEEKLMEDAPKQPAPQPVEVKEAPKAPEPAPAPKPEVKKEEPRIRSWAGNYTD